MNPRAHDFGGRALAQVAAFTPRGAEHAIHVTGGAEIRHVARGFTDRAYDMQYRGSGLEGARSARGKAVEVRHLLHGGFWRFYGFYGF